MVPENRSGFVVCALSTARNLAFLSFGFSVFLTLFIQNSLETRNEVCYQQCAGLSVVI